MMKTMLILRHAKSSWANTRLADHDRPLNKRGKTDASRMGVLMRREEIIPDWIISSTAERALATAEAVALALDFEGELEQTRELYLADPEAYIEVCSQLPDQVNQLLVVGHNPGIEELVTLLTGARETMPTAALAQVSLPIANWKELDEATEGKLVNLWWPKALDD